jgi:hypothetical protein
MSSPRCDGQLALVTGASQGGSAGPTPTRSVAATAPARDLVVAIGGVGKPQSVGGPGIE